MLRAHLSYPFDAYNFIGSRHDRPNLPGWSIVLFFTPTILSDCQAWAGWQICLFNGRSVTAVGKLSRLFQLHGRLKYECLFASQCHLCYRSRRRGGIWDHWGAQCCRNSSRTIRRHTIFDQLDSIDWEHSLGKLYRQYQLGWNRRSDWTPWTRKCNRHRGSKRIRWKGWGENIGPRITHQRPFWLRFESRRRQVSWWCTKRLGNYKLVWNHRY